MVIKCPLLSKRTWGQAQCLGVLVSHQCQMNTKLSVGFCQKHLARCGTELLGQIFFEKTCRLVWLYHSLKFQVLRNIYHITSWRIGTIPATCQ